jgi:hypothetical protein
MTDSSNIVDTQTPATPPNTRVLANGAVYDLDRGRIIAAPPNDRQPINQESARDFHVYRQRKQQQAELAAQHGLARIVPGNPSALRAWAEIVEAQAKQAKSGKAHSDANARFVGQATGFLQDQRKAAPTSFENAKIQVNVLGAGIAQQLLAQLSGVIGMLDGDQDDNDSEG